MHGNTTLLAIFASVITIAISEIMRQSINKWFITRKPRAVKENEERKEYQSEIAAWQGTSEGWQQQAMALRAQIAELNQQTEKLRTEKAQQAVEMESLHSEIDNLRSDIGEILLENRRLRDHLGEEAHSVPRAKLKAQRVRS